MVIEKSGMDDTELTSLPACPFGMSHVRDVSPNHPNKLVRY
jgi:hypothetical protein